MIVTWPCKGCGTTWEILCAPMSLGGAAFAANYDFRCPNCRRNYTDDFEPDTPSMPGLLTRNHRSTGNKVKFTGRKFVQIRSGNHHPSDPRPTRMTDYSDSRCQILVCRCISS